MLKGKTIIELTDVNTGEKEVIEENNMVTNAINDLFNTFPNLMLAGNIYKGSAYYNNFVNITNARLYEMFLGGILLFDSQIEEKPENTYAPASANLVGCGVYNHQNSTGSKKRGNYNLYESEFNDEQRYMKFVYDFSTSEANGTIASVCLTSYNGGCTSYGEEGVNKILQGDKENKNYAYNFAVKVFDYVVNTNTGTRNYDSSSNIPSNINYTGTRNFAYDVNYKKALSDKEYSVLVGASSFNSPSTYSLNGIYYGEYPIFVDVDEDAVYYLKTKNFKNFWIVKRKAYLKSFSILDFPAAKGDLLEEYEVPEVTDMYKYYGGRCYFFDTETKCLYIFYNTYNHDKNKVYNNEIIKVVKIDLSNLNNITCKEINMQNTTNTTIDFNYSKRFFVNNGFLYVSMYSDNTYEKQIIFKIEIENPANILEIEDNYEANKYDIYHNFPVFAYNGIIYMENGNIIKNDKVIRTENSCFACIYYSTNYVYIKNYIVPFLMNKKVSQFFYVYDGYPTCQSTASEKSLTLYAPFNTIFCLNNYLATINNLAEPVTKTADKTMKVTYIIQETEPEEVVP